MISILMTTNFLRKNRAPPVAKATFQLEMLEVCNGNERLLIRTTMALGGPLHMMHPMVA